MQAGLSGKVLSWTHEIFDYGFKFRGALLKDFVAAFVIFIIRGY